MKILDIPRSGSYAGVTSSHNRAGQYLRNRRTPTNAPSARRTAIRSAMGSASSGYAALTASQQAAWAAAADGHPITDRLGSSIKLTGHQLYVACATQLINVGDTPQSTPPSDFSVFTVSGSTAVFSVATGLNVTNTLSAESADYIILSLSKPQSAGRGFCATFRQYSASAADTDLAAVTTSAYGALFGTPAVGQKVFVKLTPVSQYGVTGVSVVIPVVVTA